MTKLADYDGAVDLGGATAQIWARAEGRIALVQHEATTASTWTWREDLAGIEAVVYCTGRLWTAEPEMRLWEPGVFPDHNAPLVSWTQMSGWIGTAPPLFPQNLRTFAIIDRWEPGEPPVTALARDVDIASILVAAATCEPGTAAHRALTNFAAEALWDDYRITKNDIATFTDACEQLTLPWGARPLPVPEPGDLDETTIRAGWLDILDRRDDAAGAALRTMRSWTSGDRTLPFAAFTQIDPSADQWAAEWTSRLEPSPWRAAHVLFEERRPVRYLTDPATGAACAEDPDGIIHTLVPAAIPTAAALHSVILSGGHTTVWIRDTDGRLWLAPQLAADGIAWGYSGGGPWTLAGLLGRLLDDLAARATVGGKPRPGLLALCQHPWPDGTVLTRADLEAARDGRFTLPVVDTDK
ncbi:hypothetical protein [Glycomyces xiaoerkulensis]|uniref:hypothetical protein n=1 Tax=Glycomyces xiaoerkulensis TaxID=2038139 RepID=UPI000C2576CA|nr:hypothetical protein [Glycomyces xiaoerkulensis]